MIKLGSVVLSPSLRWVDRFTNYSVAQSIRYTQGGNIRVYQQALPHGRPITLQANEETGWFTNAMRENLLVLAQVVGETFVFTYFGEEYTVVFSHHTPPAAEFVKLQYRQTDQEDDYYTGTLRLIQV